MLNVVRMTAVCVVPLHVWCCLYTVLCVQHLDTCDCVCSVCTYGRMMTHVCVQVVAMRLMYGLDGEPGPEGGCEEPHSWPAWAEGIVQRCARDNPGLLSVHEVCALVCVC